ncbi:MAG TPA: site-2 protease family protein [Acidimicrobiales bacterium]
MPNASALRVAEFAILFGSIVLHEVSHGWSALWLGDDTAKRAGRLSLNPIVHVDPIGTIVLPLILIVTHAGILFGWAKPVPVNVSNLRHPRNGAVITGLAGPAMNLLLVAIAWISLRGLAPQSGWPLFLLFYFGFINLWLAIFNLLPIPPLDGSSVVERFLPKKWWGPYLSIRPYTLFLVMAVVFVGVRSGAEASVINSLYNWWASVTGLGTV